MGIQDMLAADLPKLVARDGEKITHISGDQQTPDISATISIDPQPLSASPDGNRQVLMGTAIIAVADLPKVQAYDIISRLGGDWSVYGTAKIANGTVWRLDIRRTEIIERSRERYRMG